MARHVLKEVDSTNALALRLAPDLVGPAWLMAGTQSAGRGRRARAWVSPAGNFHATLLTFPKGPAAIVALRSFAIALALHDALVALTGLGERLALKWPNDVLLDGAKLAGILLESSGSAAHVHHLAIGVGVNLIAAPPPGTLEPGALPAVSVLGQTGLTIRPEALLDHLAPAYAAWEAHLERQGFAPLRDAWLARAARLGEVITARTGKDSFSGRFETIDLHGHLILHTTSGPQAIPAADVFF